MQDRLISYNVSLLAHLAGFRKGGSTVFNSWYNGNGVLNGRIDIDENGNEINAKTHGSNFKDFYSQSYYACSQSLLQTWLRNEKKIEISILPVYGKKCGYDAYKRHGWDHTVISISDCQELLAVHYNQNYEDRIDKDTKHMFNIFETYEDALEDGFIQAFKLLNKLEA